MQLVGTKKCLGAGDVVQHFHVGGSAPQGENCKAQAAGLRDPCEAEQAGHKPQSGGITGVAAQNAQCSSVFHTHSHTQEGLVSAPCPWGPCPTHTQLTGEKPP